MPAIEAGHRPPPAGRRCTGRTPHGPVPSRGECATSAIAKIEPAGQRSSESIKVKAWPKSGAQPAAKRLVTENARTQLRSAVSAETRRPAPGTAPRYPRRGLTGPPGRRQMRSAGDSVDGPQEAMARLPWGPWTGRMGRTRPQVSGTSGSADRSWCSGRCGPARSMRNGRLWSPPILWSSLTSPMRPASRPGSSDRVTGLRARGARAPHELAFRACGG